MSPRCGCGTMGGSATGPYAHIDDNGLLLEQYPAENMVGVLSIENLPPGFKHYIDLADYPRIGSESDDSPRIGRWIDAVIAANGIGYAPPGDYAMATAIEREIVRGTRFSIIGAGPDVTRFHANSGNNDGCFIFETNRNSEGMLDAIADRVITIRDFSLVRDGVGTVPLDGTGVGFAYRAGAAPFTHNGQGSNRHNFTAFVSNIWAGGSDGRYFTWDTALDFRSHFHPAFENVVCTGIFISVPESLTNDNPSYFGQYGLVLDNAYGVSLHNCTFQNFHTGISDIGTSGEGGRLIDCRLVACRIGINRLRTGNGGFNRKSVTNRERTANVATLTVGAGHGFTNGQQVTVEDVAVALDGTHTLTAVGATTISYASAGADIASGPSTGTVEAVLDFIGAREPVFAILDSHINCRDRGIAVDGTRYMQVSRCVIYNVDTEANSAEPIDIRVANYERVDISDNIFAYWECHPERIHMRFTKEGSGFPDDALGAGSYVRNNLFVARGSRCVQQMTGTSKGFWLWNQVDPIGGTGYDMVYDDASGGDNVTIAHAGNDMSLANSTALFTSVNRGGVVTDEQRLLLGPAGSAEAGFRVVRVPN